MKFCMILLLVIVDLSVEVKNILTTSPYRRVNPTKKDPPVYCTYDYLLDSCANQTYVYLSTV